MVDGSMAADRCLAVDAGCLAAWRWVLSEFEEETLSSLIQTGESFLLKFELCLGLSWLTLPCLVLGSACGLVFSLVLVLAWLVLGFASASSVFVFVGTRRA